MTTQGLFEEIINMANMALTDYEEGNYDTCLESLDYIADEITLLHSEIEEEE